MIVEIVLQRHHEVEKVQKPGTYGTESATVGILTVTVDKKKEFRCYTIENGGKSSPIPGMDRRIMPGLYTLSYSQTLVPLPKSLEGQGILLNDPNDVKFAQRRIFIHVGNYPQDTLGCILLANSYNMGKKNGIGLQSKLAVESFYSIMERVGLGQTTLLIKEIEDAKIYNGTKTSRNKENNKA